ncbi:hypothetical protein HED60_16255 [Planctomycetales bacterium ZRK34]|nr:hypothetical protein HED60_16255 [Planctomycetales bacterium ZRK34]
MNIRQTLGVVLLICAAVSAAEPYPPIAVTVPPPGDALQPEQRTKLTADLAAVEKRLAGVDEPDIEIFAKAVRFALDFDEFYRKNDVAKAENLLKLAGERLDALAAGNKSWLTQHGNLVVGYRSTVDNTIQPFGLEIPEDLDTSKPVPLFVWLHGRGDKVTDLHFVTRCLTGHAPISPHVKNAIIVHPLGRQCIGYKSAGEIDVLDVIAEVKKRYNIDDNRIALCGFSMGGAGAWQTGAHYADQFCVVHAGAGFVDVARFLHLDPQTVPAIQRKMWHVYNVEDYVRNLFNIPVIAYSGEIDKQKLAADIMEAAYKAEGRTLPHLIGPGMGHKYHPDTLVEVMKFVNDAVAKGRDPRPQTVHVQTRVLRYGKKYDVAVLAQQKLYEDTRLDVQFGDNTRVTTKNVAAFSLGRKPKVVTIDGQKIDYADAADGRFELDGGKWVARVDHTSGLVKARGLEGPIDDAFLSPFLIVKPSGKSDDALFEQWVQFELAHTIRHWRAAFRGNPRVKMDTEITDDDIARYNLVCYGDEKTNKVIARYAKQLPMKLRDGHHVNLFIYPNPANPKKYIVLNSGPTFREADDKNNSLQNPKLGDWAVIDIETAPDDKSPGKVLDAGVFDQRWRLLAR